MSIMKNNENTILKIFHVLAVADPGLGGKGPSFVEVGNFMLWLYVSYKPPLYIYKCMDPPLHGMGVQYQNCCICTMVESETPG